MNSILLMRYVLISYISIWAIATPIMLLALFSYGIPFSTDYEAFIGRLPLHLSASIVYFSAVPSYYVPARIYFEREQAGWERWLRSTK